MLINTQPQVVATEKQRMINANTQGYNFLKMSFETSFRILNNAVNPQIVLDQWGTEAVALFQASGATIAYLQLVNPAYVPPTTTKVYTFNADGTVTYVPPVVIPPTPPTPSAPSDSSVTPTN